MTARKTDATATPGRRFSRQLKWGLVLVALLIAAVAFGPRVGAQVSRQFAIRNLRHAAVSSALQWLSWATWFDSDDGSVEMVRAFCFRHQERNQDWTAAMQAAKDKGVAEASLQREFQLQLAWSGAIQEQTEANLIATAAESLVEYDVPSTLVSGYLASRKYPLAERMLNAWAANSSNTAQIDYMWARFFDSRGQPQRAREFLSSAIAQEQRHELARFALAESLESADQLEPALTQFTQLAVRSANNEPATLGIARILRRKGLLNRARSVLAPFAVKPDPAVDVAAEMGRIEMESGDYKSAQDWLEKSDLEQTSNLDLLATVAGLNGDAALARRLFDVATRERNRFVHAHDLQVRLAIHAGDDQAVDTLRRLANSSVASDLERTIVQTAGKPSPTAGELYALHCATCHGDGGNGDGPAARHLFPAPRDLRHERLRLVSTVRGVATGDDVVAVIRQGIPGTSMPPFPDLKDHEVNDLADEVLRLRREGLRHELVNDLAEESLEEAEIQELLDARMEPGEPMEVPSMAVLDGKAIARGRGLFMQHGCATCHGKSGIGAPNATWFDSKLRPQRPRDLVYEKMKGGDTAESLFRRIALGMPGTPHPASRSIGEQQIVDLVAYCRSLSREPKRSLTNYQRMRLATGAAYMAAFGED